ncbi:MAG TPA: pyruvate carboxyltransferase, partial [Oceanipulchritudo sp.]|nr:pyruvate carboxyltransferase [Oceanipulchritudo sp.]
VGVQAMLNVKFGRWKNFSPQAMDIALGYYGQTPAPVNEEVRNIAAEKTGKEPITCRPADLIDPRMDKLRADLKEEGLPSDDEHCVIWAMFPQELKKHYASKKEAPAKPAPQEVRKPSPEPEKAEPVRPANEGGGSGREVHLTINGTNYTAMVEEITDQ